MSGRPSRALGDRSVPYWPALAATIGDKPAVAAQQLYYRSLSAPDRQVRISGAELGRDLDWHRTTAWRVLQRITELGVVEREGNSRPDSGDRLLYRLQADRIQELLPPGSSLNEEALANLSAGQAQDARNLNANCAQNATPPALQNATPDAHPERDRATENGSAAAAAEVEPDEELDEEEAPSPPPSVANVPPSPPASGGAAARAEADVPSAPDPRAAADGEEGEHRGSGEGGSSDEERERIYVRAQLAAQQAEWAREDEA